MNTANFLTRLRRRLAPRRNSDRGSMLFDVLLGMAIFILIAVIGILAAGHLRNRAYVIQATADVRQVGHGIEAALTAPGTSFDDLGLEVGVMPTTTLDLLGVNLTVGDTAYVVDATPYEHVVCVANEHGAYAVFSAPRGAVTESGTSGGCGAASGGSDEDDDGESAAYACDGSTGPPSSTVDTDGDGFTDLEEYGAHYDCEDPDIPWAGGHNGDIDGDGYSNIADWNGGLAADGTTATAADWVTNPNRYPGWGAPAAQDPNGDDDGDGVKNSSDPDDNDPNVPLVGGMTGDADGDGYSNGYEMTMGGQAAVNDPTIPCPRFACPPKQ